MTCCIVGKHPNIADIDRLIRAQQAAKQRGESMSSPSYSQIARMFHLSKPTLLRHKDGCLVQRRSTGDGPVQGGGPHAEAIDENASDSAECTVVDRGGPSAVPGGAQADDGRSTGPPGDGTERHGVSRSSVPDAPDRVAQRDTGVAVDERDGEVSRSPTPLSSDDPARARARENGRRGWTIAAQNAIQQAARNLANTTHDCAIRDPSQRTHASYVEEVAEIVQSGEWENERTVQRLTRAWGKSKLFVVQCHSDACTLIRVARGSRFDQIESSAARWMNIYNIARKNEDPEAQRVAIEAMKGHDRVLGLVDAGAKVQINNNIAQSDEAKLFVSIFLDEARDNPAMLERIRRRMEAVRDKLGDPTALLTTGEVAE